MEQAPTIWVTLNKNSQVVCSAVHRATGFPIKQIHDAGPMPGPSIVYGLLRGCSELIRRCETYGADYWHIDHGYFKRSAPEKFAGYYRITKNGLAVSGTPPPNESVVRWEALGIEIAPMRSPVGPVLVCPPTVTIAAHFGIKPMEWANHAVHEATCAGLGTILRLKGSVEPASEAIARCGSVVAYNSNIAIDAMVAGVRAQQVIGPARLSYETFPGAMPRKYLFAWLANHQWKLDEITPEIFS